LPGGLIAPPGKHQDRALLRDFGEAIIEGERR